MRCRPGAGGAGTLGEAPCLPPSTFLPRGEQCWMGLCFPLPLLQQSSKEPVSLGHQGSFVMEHGTHKQHSFWCTVSHFFHSGDCCLRASARENFIFKAAVASYISCFILAQALPQEFARCRSTKCLFLFSAVVPQSRFVIVCLPVWLPDWCLAFGLEWQLQESGT